MERWWPQQWPDNDVEDDNNGGGGGDPFDPANSATLAYLTVALKASWYWNHGKSNDTDGDNGLTYGADGDDSDDIIISQWWFKQGWLFEMMTEMVAAINVEVKQFELPLDFGQHLHINCKVRSLPGALIEM